MNIFMFLTFFYMFIVLSTFSTFTSTFTTISYIPIEKRVPQNAQKPRPQSFVPAVGLPPLLLWLHGKPSGDQSRTVFSIEKLLHNLFT